ncbi:hypothetical protein YC2023_109298 [Brassica napus]
MAEPNIYLRRSEALASSASSECRAYNSLNRRPGVCHSTFEYLRLGRSSQSIAFGFFALRFPELQERQGVCGNHDFVIHGFTSVGRANHYMPSLKESSIVKVDRFEVARCSSMYKINDHSFVLCFISLTIIDEVITDSSEINLQSRLDYVVGQIRYVQGSDVTKETSRVVIPNKREANTTTPGNTRDNPNRHKGGNTISTCSLLLSYENSLHAQCQQANAIVFL